MADETTTPKYREWQAPPQAVAESLRLGWLRESTEEGQSWLKNQRGYPDMRRAIDVLSGTDVSTRSLSTTTYRSRINPNPLKRDIQEVVGALSKLRPMWGYHSNNSAYKLQAEMMNKTVRALYLENSYDLSIKDALAWAAATARGWVFPMYRRKMYGTGEGELSMFTYGAPSVLPNQLPNSNDWQEAYVVHLLDEMPVAMAHGMFPRFQSRLRPSQSRFWYASDHVRRAATGNWLRRAFGQILRGPDAEAMSDMLVPVRRTYIIDLTVNRTGREIPMGEGTWAYRVPYLGQSIPIGTDPKTGEKLTRPANENDARVYPRRRLMISTDQCIMYDGPGFDWHGMFPGASFCLDAWPWEPLGFSLVHNGYEINEAIKDIDRGNMDKVRAMLNLPLSYDVNGGVSRRDAASVDPMMPNGRYGFDGSATEGSPFSPLVDLKYYEIDQRGLEFRNMLEEKLHQQLAISDVMALAKLRAIGTMDDIEKIVEANGPIVESMSRSMERPIRDLGVMLKFLVLQNLTVARVMQYIGANGVTPETFDYDPSSLVPSHLVGEDPSKESMFDKIERARNFAGNLRFLITPNSLHELTQMQFKLILIQLRKAGIMIDSQTIAEACNVPNYGEIEGNTVIERFNKEQEMKLELAARMKEVASGLGLTPPGAADPAAGKQNPEGRPNANTAPPEIASKDGGTRSTITTSK